MNTELEGWNTLGCVNRLLLSSTSRSSYLEELIMKVTISLLAVTALVIPLAGCGSSSDESGAGPTDAGSAPIVMDEMPPMLDDAHGHAEHGPHGGELVELGKEDFHAELVHGDEGIEMYVLDGSATKMVSIPAEKLVVSLKHQGQVRSFDLPAKPEESDEAGLAARFVSTDPQFDEWLDAGAEGAVVIQIQGKSYTGKITHDDDHEGHNH